MSKKKINEKRSKSMRESWRRRKAAKLNGEVMPVGNVIEAVRTARKLVDLCGGNKEVAGALVSEKATVHF